MRFVVISDPNRSAGGRHEFRVHKSGCGDIGKHLKKPKYGSAGSSWDVEADSPEEAVAKEVAGFVACEQDWGVNDFLILPCCRK